MKQLFTKMGRISLGMVVAVLALVGSPSAKAAPGEDLTFALKKQMDGGKPIIRPNLPLLKSHPGIDTYVPHLRPRDSNPLFDYRKPDIRVELKQVLTLAEARKVFTAMARQKDITFRFPTDGCYARAHLMVQRLQKRNIQAFKAWTFARSKTNPLVARTRNHPRGYVSWGYHVAPCVQVRLKSGKLVYMVIDPSMFKKPVSVATWAKAQKRSPRSANPLLCVTRPGEAPTGPNGKCPGTGYWPGADPRGGADYHALRVMKLFKPYEGRMAPKRVLEMVAKL